MSENLELSHFEFKTILSNMLKNFLQKVDNKQEQISNVSREVKALRETQKEILHPKHNKNEKRL